MTVSSFCLNGKEGSRPGFRHQSAIIIKRPDFPAGICKGNTGQTAHPFQFSKSNSLQNTGGFIGKMLFNFGFKQDFFQFACPFPIYPLSSLTENGKLPVLRLKNISLASGTLVFKALADESRLRILNLMLFREELSITDLELILDFTQTKTARLMGILKTAGLVQSRRQDYWVFYKLKEESVELLQDLIGLMEKDAIFQKDIRSCEVMESNRELMINKMALRQYKPRNYD